MKYLKRYSESSRSDEFLDIGENIKDMLHDITDNGLYVTYKQKEGTPTHGWALTKNDSPTKRYSIVVSSYEIGSHGENDTVFFRWSDISPTIHRIESYLKEFDRHIQWSVYVSGVLIRKSSATILEYLDKTNPSAIDFEVEIEIFTHEEWKKLWDKH